MTDESAPVLRRDKLRLTEEETRGSLSTIQSMSFRKKLQTTAKRMNKPMIGGWLVIVNFAFC